MNINEAIARVATLPDGAMLFAELVEGRFRPESECVVAEVPESEVSTPTAELVERYAPGKHYFLEVPTVIDVLEAWSEQRKGAEPSMAEAVEAVIFYAENDAYV
jgi:hypothetical protein